MALFIGFRRVGVWTPQSSSSSGIRVRRYRALFFTLYLYNRASLSCSVSLRRVLVVVGIEADCDKCCFPFDEENPTASRGL